VKWGVEKTQVQRWHLGHPLDFRKRHRWRGEARRYRLRPGRDGEINSPLQRRGPPKRKDELSGIRHPYSERFQRRDCQGCAMVWTEWGASHPFQKRERMGHPAAWPHALFAGDVRKDGGFGIYRFSFAGPKFYLFLPLNPALAGVARNRE